MNHEVLFVRISEIRVSPKPQRVKHISPAVASFLAPASYPGFVRHHVLTTLKAVAQSGPSDLTPHSAFRTPHSNDPESGCINFSNRLAN